MDFCGCFSGVAGCSGTAVCVVKGSRSRCKEKRFRVSDYENRTCSPCCSRCQMDFWGGFSGVAGCSGTAVCVVKGSWSRCKEKRLCVPDYENRTCSPCCNRCQMDFWGGFSGGAGVPERRSVSSRAAGADAKRNGFVCPIMRTALATSVAAAAKWISGAASLGVQVFRNGGLCSQGSRSRCKEKRFRVPDYENRTCSPCCNRCQMDFWGCSSGGAGCSGTAVCVVRAAGADAKRNGFVCPIMRTALAVCVATVAKWISGAVSLGLQAVPERRSV